MTYPRTLAVVALWASLVAVAGPESCQQRWCDRTAPAKIAACAYCERATGDERALLAACGVCLGWSEICGGDAPELALPGGAYPSSRGQIERDARHHLDTWRCALPTAELSADERRGCEERDRAALIRRAAELEVASRKLDRQIAVLKRAQGRDL